MKYIKKSIRNEPASLKETRSTPGSTYDDCYKEPIRLALLLEQGSICAYCMRRIDNNKNKKGLPNTRIEHFEAQSNQEDLKLNYLNMLGVCDGNEGNSNSQLTCDKRRGNQLLTIDPRKKTCEKLIAYDNNGNIYSDNPRVEKELNEVLGLNHRNLVRDRENIIKTARTRLQIVYKKKKNHTWSKSDILKEINSWQSKNNNRYREFCMAAIYYLEKKLVRL